MTGMSGRIAWAGALVAALALAGCSRGAQDAGLGMPDPGFSGGADAGAGGFGTGAIGGGTLPGTSIGDTVRFAVDQSTLSAEAIGTLNAQIGWLVQNPSVPVEIEGHADERGTEQYNIQLGARRAAAVRDYMVSQGIPDTRVRTNTFGRARPVATCPDESCWAQNRRAVTVVVAGPGV
jgi:peptidoglycan-associated lipoprotein